MASTDRFNVVETTIADIHAAYRSGDLTARQFVPAIVVPAGFTRDGLPAGITFLGRPYDDANMIRYAFAYERATQHRRAPSTTP